jgi:hypothetical protein
MLKRPPGTGRLRAGPLAASTSTSHTVRPGRTSRRVVLGLLVALMAQTCLLTTAGVASMESSGTPRRSPRPIPRKSRWPRELARPASQETTTMLSRSARSARSARPALHRLKYPAPRRRSLRHPVRTTRRLRHPLRSTHPLDCPKRRSPLVSLCSRRQSSPGACSSPGAAAVEPPQLLSHQSQLAEPYGSAHLLRNRLP